MTKKVLVKNKTGFTLIELIVVITIIAVLTVVGVVNYGGASRRSRDGRRMADLEKIRMALEMYRQEKGTYPALSSQLSPTYLPTWPVDPKSTFTYDYAIGVGSSYTYTLRAQMEDLGSTNLPQVNGCGTGQKCNYEVINP